MGFQFFKLLFYEGYTEEKQKLLIWQNYSEINLIEDILCAAVTL